MDNEMNVKLGIDTSDYTKGLDEALKVFNSFQTQLSSKKLGFSQSQINEFNKIFIDIRNTATNELAKIQKRIESINGKNITLGFQKENLESQIKDLEAELKIAWREEDTDAIKKKLEALKKNLSKIDINIDMNDQALESAQQEYIDLLEELKANPLEFEFETPSLIKFNTQIDNVIEGLKRYGQQAKEAGDKTDEFKNKTENAARTSTRLNLMGRIMSQIKNSIAAALNPLNWFRKSWNEIIMSDGSKFANTFKNIKANILEYLTPVLQTIAQWLVNLIGYVNVFLKALSGGKIDLFKKSAKSAASTAKSTKEIAKNTASFDELNDIGQSSSGGGGVSGGGGELAQPELNEKWVKTLTEWGEKVKIVWDKIKKFFSWVKKNIGTIGAIALAVAGVILVFSLLNKVLGGITGPLIAIGVLLAGIGVVLLSVANLMTVMEETGTSIEDLAWLMIAVLAPLAAAVLVFAAATKLIDLKGLAALVVIFVGLVAVIEVIKDLLVTMTENGITATDMFAEMAVIVGSVIALIVALTAAAVVLGTNPMAMLAVLEVVGAVCAILLVMAATLPTILDATASFFERTGPIMIQILDKLWQIIDRILDTLDNLVNNLIIPILVPLLKNIRDFIAGLIDVVGRLINKMVDFFNSVKDKVVGVFIAGGEIFIGIWEGVLDVCKTIINAIIDGANAVIGAPFKVVNGILNTIKDIDIPIIGKPFYGFWGYNPLPVPQIPRLSVGTEFVPQDMLAMIHKGEAVIPKEFNDKSYFGNNNNEETNRLLLEVIEAINDIEITPYTTIKDVGESSVKYIRDKSRSLGRSLI